MSDKSKWDSHDWRNWLETLSEDAVVTELMCQYREIATLKSRQAALIEKLRGRLVIGHKQIEDIILFLEGEDE